MIDSCAYITLYNRFKWGWKDPGLGSNAYWDWKHSVPCVDSRLGSLCIMWGAFQYKADEEVQLCTVVLSSSCLHHCSVILQNGHQKFFMTTKNRYCFFCRSCLLIFKRVLYVMDTEGKKYKSRWIRQNQKTHTHTNTHILNSLLTPSTCEIKQTQLQIWICGREYEISLIDGDFHHGMKTAPSLWVLPLSRPSFRDDRACISDWPAVSLQKRWQMESNGSFIPYVAFVCLSCQYSLTWATIVLDRWVQLL